MVRRSDRFIVGEFTCFYVIRDCSHDNGFEHAFKVCPIIGMYNDNSLTQFLEKTNSSRDVMPDNIEVGCVFSDDRFIAG